MSKDIICNYCQGLGWVEGFFSDDESGQSFDTSGPCEFCRGERLLWSDDDKLSTLAIATLEKRAHSRAHPEAAIEAAVAAVEAELRRRV